MVAEVVMTKACGAVIPEENLVKFLENFDKLITAKQLT